VKAQTIRAANRLYKSFSSEHADLENLAWTQELILNSCDDELAKVLRAKLLAADSFEVEGPLAFFCLVQEVIQNTEEISHALISKLQNYTLTSITGKNV
jgi:hypothetical protein